MNRNIDKVPVFTFNECEIFEVNFFYFLQVAFAK